MDAYTGEIRIMGFNFAPQDWAFCNGAQLPVAQQQVLFSILGYAYGGSGQNFLLPNLLGCAAAGAGSGPRLTPRPAGAFFGTDGVTLNSGQFPPHNHTVMVEVVKTAAAVGTDMTSNPVPQATAGGSLPGRALASVSASSVTPVKAFAAATVTPDAALSANTIGAFGVLQPLPHENRQPYLPMNFCICMNGIYPVRSTNG